jgi:3-deoxy-D-manno-octulosonic-acid transferase
LSERSARGYARIRGLTAAMLRDITLIAAQAEADAERFRALGAPRVRSDRQSQIRLAAASRSAGTGATTAAGVLGEKRPVWIAASTHAGEDEPILDAFAILARPLAGHCCCCWCRVTRNVSTAWRCAVSTAGFASDSAQRTAALRMPDTAVFLGDSMGELLLFYAAADLAFVGGSLVATGGHNVLEPALLGLPVLFGPHMFNFTEAGERLLEAEAAWRVAERGGTGGCG